MYTAKIGLISTFYDDTADIGRKVAWVVTHYILYNYLFQPAAELTLKPSPVRHHQAQVGPTFSEWSSRRFTMNTASTLTKGCTKYF